jgi:hypothetical protein
MTTVFNTFDNNFVGGIPLEGSSSKPVMSQKIFQLGLAVETVSLYLLCVSLAELAIPLAIDNMRKKWNGTDRKLTQALSELEEQNILQCVLTDKSGMSVYQLVDEDKWK